MPGELPRGGAARIPFVSAISGAQLAELPEGHWQRWQRSPVKFAEALSLARRLSESKLGRGRATVLEMGAHPVLAAAIQATFSDGLRYASSMRRGEHAAPFLRHQRAGLGPGFRRGLSRALRGFSFGGRELCHTTSFAAQGIASQQLVLLTEALKPFFPGLAAHDLYRFSSIEALLDWGVEESQAPRPVRKMQEPTPELHFEILGCALRLPGGGADSPPPGSFWSMLLEDDQDSAFAFKEGAKGRVSSAQVRPPRRHAGGRGCWGRRCRGVSWWRSSSPTAAVRFKVNQMARPRRLGQSHQRSGRGAGQSRESGSHPQGRRASSSDSTRPDTSHLSKEAKEEVELAWQEKMQKQDDVKKRADAEKKAQQDREAKRKAGQEPGGPGRATGTCKDVEEGHAGAR